MLARDRIKPRARFVENQQLRPRHQCPSDQDTLPLSLRQYSPGPLADRFHFDLAQNPLGLAALRGLDLAPHPDYCVAAADNRVKRNLMALNQLMDAGTHYSNALAQFAPIGLSVGFSEHRNLARSERHIPG